MKTATTRLSVAAVTALFAMTTLMLTQPAVGAAEPSVGLGQASSFVVLAATTVTNTGPSVVSGSLGVSPGTAITGFPPGLVNDGAIHSADAVAAGAQADLTTAYDSAAGRASNVTVSADLAGQQLVGGVYTGGALALNGTLTLDAENVPDTVWIFRAASTLITGSGSTVALVNGANPCNVFWQVGSSATLGTGTTFVGTVMALTSVSAMTAATVQGRLLARNGAVTLDNNVISRPDCTPAPTTTSTPPDSSTTAAPTSTTEVGATSTTAAPTSTTEVGATSTTAAPTSTTEAGATSTTAAPTTTTTAVSPTSTMAAPTTTIAAVGPTTTIAAHTTATSAAPTTTAPRTATTRATGTTASTVARLAAPTTVTTVLGQTATPWTATHPELPRTGAPLVATTTAAVLFLLLGATLRSWSRRGEVS